MRFQTRRRQPRDPETGLRIARRMQRICRAWERWSFPVTVFFLFANPQFRPRYEMTWARKITLAWRMFRNTKHIPTGVSYKAHLAMAGKVLEISPDIEGVIVECGCWQGGTTANLSLVCDIVDRQLVVYDSFEGLPSPNTGDGMNQMAHG